jgi:ribonucleoside-diphosphate reductase alpha chain
METDSELARVIGRANQVWEETLELAERFGVENSQVSVLAPTGTIGFMMDCDTTGVEPDLALKKVKKMVGGGTMSIVNQTLPRALRRLGYNSEQNEAIVAYVEENNTVIGAPALKPEHYDVFACSFTTDNLIGHMGHVKMMAAVQPFISGAISKTVNVPEQASVEDMEEIFVEGWRLGLKAVAMYRDNCKADQPLSAETKKTVDESVGETPALAARRRMPRIRQSVTYSFRVADTEGYVHVGLYPDTGQPGELFIKVAKQGSTLAGVMGAFALSVSMGLQHGVPLATFVEKFVNDTFEPHGITDDPDIRFAKSLMDYIFRRLALDFLPEEKRLALGIRSVQERTEALDGPPANGGNGVNIIKNETRTEEQPGSTADLVPTLDAPLCSNCGTRMRPAGSCFACESCGSTSGCS